MATFWDVGALEYITPVLVFIFVFVVIFAILQKFKILGGHQRIDFIVSLVVSLIALISENAVKLVGVLSTWYVLLLVAVILIVLAVSAGIKEGGDAFELGWRIIIWPAVIILLVSIAHVFGPVFTPYSESADPGWWALRTIFHPNVFGTLLLMLIALVLIGNVIKETK